MFSILSFLMLLLGNAALAQQNDIWSLRRCLDHAREANIQLKQAQLNVESDEVALTQARARRLPNLNFGTNYGLRFGYFVDPFTNFLQTQNSQTVDMGLSSAVDLFNGGTISNTIKQTQINLRASQADLEQQEYDLALDVTLAYLQILQSGEVLESARIQVGSTKEQRDRTDKLVKAGVLAQADLLQLEAQIATEELNVVNAQNQLELAYLALQQLLNLDPQQPFGIEKLELPDPEGDFMTTPTSEIIQYAESHQPFIKSADLNVQSANLGVEIAKGDLYPSLNLSASLGTGYSNTRERRTGNFIEKEPTVSDVLLNGNPATITFPNADPEFENYPFFDQLGDNRSTRVSLGLSIPIYNRNQVRSNIDRAQIQLENARYTADLRRQQLQQTIEQAYVDLRTAFSTYSSTQKQMNALDLTFQNTEKQFNLGVVNSVDYLIAKNNLNRARFDLVRTKYVYIFRQKVLDFYQGKPLSF